jgi:putative chitinase
MTDFLVEYQKLKYLKPDGVVGKNTALTLMQDFNIQNVVQLSHFLAQIDHESRRFTATRENLNYSEEGLRKYFSKYFKEEEFALFARKPEKIANRVYANRFGNGSEASGDGWKYRGGLAIQITFKTNWELLAGKLGLPLDIDPDSLIDPKYYFKSADIYFDENSVWKYCVDMSENSILNVSRKINLGTVKTTKMPNGYKERKDLSYSYYKALARVVV